MFTLRCTQKLQTRLGAQPSPELAPADTVLGDWYANLLRIGRAQLVIAVSERTLLPVVVPAREARNLVTRVGDALELLLLSIGIPSPEVLAERGAMSSWTLGKTASRRVLGSLNDLAFQLEVGLTHFPQRTLLEQSLWLAKTPMKVIEYAAPDAATVAAFAACRELHRVRMLARG